jgi:hypothetical protein
MLQTFNSAIKFSMTEREVTMHPLTAGELDSVAALNTSVHWTFLGICTGGLVSVGITLLTVSFTSPILFAGFVGATGVSALGCVVFGTLAGISHKEAQRKLKEVKRGIRGSKN